MDNGSILKTEKGSQRLLQFHFHSPSEHTVDGQSFPLEVHFVHVNDAGQLSVLGVLFEEGDANTAFADILANAPASKGSHTAAGKYLKPGVFLPEGDEVESFYRLMGSLTTPPCSEGVNWYVSDARLTVSHEQAEAFQQLFHGGNARPVQPLHERVLKFRHD